MKKVIGIGRYIMWIIFMSKAKRESRDCQYKFRKFGFRAEIYKK